MERAGVTTLPPHLIWFLANACLDRRILCDRALPTCAQCFKSGRMCQGYGLRLSWPKARDRKRAKVGKLPRAKTVARRSMDQSLVNASSWDIEMHYYLLGLVSESESPNSTESMGLTSLEYNKLVLQAPMPFNPFQLNVQEIYLFEYCERSWCIFHS